MSHKKESETRKNPVWDAILLNQIDMIFDIDISANQANEVREVAGMSGVTPLMLVCQNGCVDHTRVLVAAGADVNARLGGLESYSPLMFAIKSCEIEKVVALLDAGAKINGIGPNEASTSPLGIACTEGTGEIVSLLFQRGADPCWSSEGCNLIKRVAMDARDDYGANRVSELVELGQL